MNLAELFETQKILDERIVKEKGLEGQDLLPKKILALQVELGELANELPEVFKFWSNKKNNYERALKEFVDCLHFILSIGLELKEIGMEPVQEFNYWSFKSGFGLIESIGSLITDFYCIDDDKEKYVRLFCTFIGLGEILGFTWEQIEQAYFEKNKINHARQDGGY